MGVETTTKTTYVCDRCGFASEQELARRASADVTIRATVMSYNGDVGGASTKQWLCGDCYSDFLKWMKEVLR